MFGRYIGQPNVKLGSRLTASVAADGGPAVLSTQHVSPHGVPAQRRRWRRGQQTTPLQSGHVMRTDVMRSFFLM
jgi:hypothetical protein